ncbi:PTH11-like G-protein-coupled receptor [Trichoderma parareesei]|uniref:PTH11-like G-protein-coupled receptor n=1 Tax=Trichoderma parareesei TaxID=858221 RepID=A0A2H2ZF71_TRIPA|nr:PTH11-like G-protein-coupled receptor [Trichoderma parareesei]
MAWVLNADEAINHESQYPTIVIICAVLSFFSILIVGTRLYIRYHARGLAGDDWMAALSVVFALIYSILCIVQTRYGLGLPIKDRPAASLIPYTRVNFAGRPIYQLGISFFKIALLISYLRLLKGTDQNTYRKVVFATILVVFLGHLGCALSLIFACHPVDKSWNPLKAGTCLPAGPSFTAYAVVTIVSDIIVAIIPLPVLLKLNVQLGKKVGLIGIFLLGLFTTICSILRYTQINRISNGDGNSTMLVLWGTIEFNVGNMVSSLPFLAPVFMRKAKEYRTKNSYNHGSSHQNSRGGPKGEHIKLSDVTNSRDQDKDKSVILSTGKSSSEENILQGAGIMKSVTYSVRVDDDSNQPRRRNDSFEDNV